MSHITGQPVVNALLLAMAATAAGRGSDQCISERIETVRKHADGLEGLYRLMKDYLTAAMQIETEAGLRILLQGLQTPDLQEAMVLIRTGAEHMQPFIDWDRNAEKEQVEQFCRFNIPVVGYELQVALEGARSADRSVWPLGIRRVRRMVGTLESFWSEARTCLVVPTESIEDVDRAIAQLRRRIWALSDETHDGHRLLDDCEDALLTLSDAFDTVDRAAVRKHTLDGLPGLYFDLIFGVRSSTIPDAALARIVATMPLPATFSEARESILMYLETGDPDALSHAACCLTTFAHMSETGLERVA